MALIQMIKEFKRNVIKEAMNPQFLHHKWFVKYHLEIVEKLANELCDLYPEADKDIVNTLVWLHDYEKIKRHENSKNGKQNGRSELEEIGFPDLFIDKCMKYEEIIDNKIKLDMSKQNIEVKIISSADGAAHFVGPFFSLWWYENSEKTMEELMESNIAKVTKDWERKIVLPEVRNKFEERMNIILEQNGELPKSYLN